MYCVYDENNKLQAIHKKIGVIKKYLRSISATDQDSMFFVKKQSKKNIDPGLLYDLYLVPYYDTFIQDGYQEYINILTDQSYEEIKKAISVCFSVYETNNITQKEKKTILKTIKILSDICENDIKYIPTLAELNRIKDSFEPYKNKYY